MQEAGSDSATVISVAIGAAAVILSAGIGAFMTWWAVEKTVKSEGDHLREQLNSDRRLRDVESLREVFDVSLQAATQYHVALSVYENDGNVEAFEHRARPALLEAMGANDRLILRLGSDMEAAQAYSELLGSFRRLRAAIAHRDHAALSAPAPGDDQEEQWAKQRQEARGRLDDAREKCDSERKTFVRAARGLVAAELEVDQR